MLENCIEIKRIRSCKPSKIDDCAVRTDIGQYPNDYHLKETEWRWMREPNELATAL